MDDAVGRLPLVHLDGRHERHDLISLLEREARAGRLAIEHGGEAVSDSAELRDMLAELVDRHLGKMKESGLLEG